MPTESGLSSMIITDSEYFILIIIYVLIPLLICNVSKILEWASLSTLYPCVGVCVYTYFYLFIFDILKQLKIEVKNGKDGTQKMNIFKKK